MSQSYIRIVCSDDADPEFNRIEPRKEKSPIIKLQPGENILTVTEKSGLQYGFFPWQNRKGMMHPNENCQSVIEVDLSNFDAYNVQFANFMFDDMFALKRVDFSNVRFENVSDMTNMFGRCSSLEEIVVNSTETFKSDKLQSANGMFYGVDKIKSLYLVGFGGSNLKSIIGMFTSMDSLCELDLSGWNLQDIDVGRVEESLFEGCNSLEKIYMRGCNELTIRKIRKQLENPYFYAKPMIIQS